ncbi:MULTISPECIES: hypothetical protein [Actinoplanes]|uniref:hypothetical protein n=1 Tax=Actinoplanes TaxID=1865 RepID=UPI0005F29027|nr:MULTISPECIES: hypothetical protein [Actinoplanes]GLY06304.1 hypothetical protein Acsp01_66830 [Actinoplanes sp. NBRC 101535]
MMIMSLLAAAGLFVLRRPAVASRPDTPVVLPPLADSTEGLFVVQLLRGELTREQYRDALACLAARDEERHPMPLPRE